MALINKSINLNIDHIQNYSFDIISNLNNIIKINNITYNSLINYFKND